MKKTTMLAALLLCLLGSTTLRAQLVEDFVPHPRYGYNQLLKTAALIGKPSVTW